MALAEVSSFENAILNDKEGITRSISDNAPSHYIIKVKQFSLLKENNIESYESNEFEAGGYRWKLVFHPDGNKQNNVSQHLSVYLAVAEPTTRPPGWEVHAVFGIFLLDQNKDNYLKVEDTTEKGRRFHRLKTEWGFDQFIHLKAFNDPCNGYLLDDTCIFGAEVFVCRERSKGQAECLSMIKNPIPYKYTWKIANFGNINSTCEDSKPFNAGGHKWKIQLYVDGKGYGMGSHVSLFLALADPAALSPGSKIFADFTLRILDKLNSRHQYGTAKYWFSASKQETGWSRFISHSYLHQPNMGFLLNDICWVEAEINIHGMTNPLG